MKWKIKDTDAWHRWFAWKWVQVDGNYIWLQTIYRRKHPYPYVTKPGIEPKWDYAETEFDLLKITAREEESNTTVGYALNSTSGMSVIMPAGSGGGGGQYPLKTNITINPTPGSIRRGGITKI